MMFVPAGVKVHLALGYTDMRKGMDGLAMLVQDTLKKDPFSGHLFAFRCKRASILKVLFWDGNGLCLFTKRIDQGGFVWPVMASYDGSITHTSAQPPEDGERTRRPIDAPPLGHRRAPVRYTQVPRRLSALPRFRQGSRRVEPHGALLQLLSRGQHSRLRRLR
ncbi:putative insertion sequence transposase protein [Bradyrhizobium sp. BTAi1]|nr:putative insertion sequence transposase protein [Bradyrhizobium sp. BTAi1]